MRPPARRRTESAITSRPRPMPQQKGQSKAPREFWMIQRRRVRRILLDDAQSSMDPRKHGHYSGLGDMPVHRDDEMRAIPGDRLVSETRCGHGSGEKRTSEPAMIHSVRRTSDEYRFPATLDHRYLHRALVTGCVANSSEKTGAIAANGSYGPNPTLPKPRSTLIPTIRIAEAKGWRRRRRRRA